MKKLIALICILSIALMGTAFAAETSEEVVSKLPTKKYCAMKAGALFTTNIGSVMQSYEEQGIAVIDEVLIDSDGDGIGDPHYVFYLEGTVINCSTHGREAITLPTHLKYEAMGAVSVEFIYGCQDADY